MFRRIKEKTSSIINRYKEKRMKSKAEYASIVNYLVKEGIAEKRARKLAKLVVKGELTKKQAVKLGRKLDEHALKQYYSRMVGNGSRLSVKKRKRRGR